jgi:hypothetical protein
MTQQAFRQTGVRAGASDLADHTSLEELESIVAGNFERKAKADEPVARVFDIESELLRELDAPVRQSPMPRARSLATPQARRELPAHASPSLDATLEDQLLGELQPPSAGEANGWDVAMAQARLESGIVAADGVAMARSGPVAPAMRRANPAPQMRSLAEPMARQALMPTVTPKPEQAKTPASDDLDSLAREFAEPEVASGGGAEIAPGFARDDIAHAAAGAEPGVSAPRPATQGKQAFSEIDLDFGAAFKTAFDKINTDRVEQQMRESTRLTATDRMERAAAADARSLEAQFANAFEEELAMSVQAIRGARQTQSPAAMAEPVRGASAARKPQAQQHAPAQHKSVAQANGATEAVRRSPANMAARAERGPDPYAALLERELRAADLQATVSGEEFDEPQFAPAPRRRGGLRLAGYGLAAVLIAGMGAASYAYFSKGDASSDPLLIKADADPFKIKPENPGGAQIANQDKAAYERLSGKFSNDAKQEKLIESAEEPVKIANAAQGDAVVGGDLNSAVANVAEEKAGERLAPGEAEKTRSLAAIQPRRVKTLAIRADGTVVPGDTAAAAEAAAKLAAGDVKAKAATDPVKVDTVRVNEAKTADAAGKDNELKVASIEAVQAGKQAAAAGAWAIQVSSQKSAADADAAFRNLQRKFPQLLEGKQMEIQKAEVADKGTFFRVRVLAPSKEEAGSFCEKLKGAGGSCFVTR